MDGITLFVQKEMEERFFKFTVELTHKNNQTQIVLPNELYWADSHFQDDAFWNLTNADLMLVHNLKLILETIKDSMMKEDLKKGLDLKLDVQSFSIMHPTIQTASNQL